MKFRDGETIEAYVRRRDRYAGALIGAMTLVTIVCLFLPRWIGASVVVVAWLASWAAAFMFFN